jgi:hypothetical protein
VTERLKNNKDEDVGKEIVKACLNLMTPLLTSCCVSVASMIGDSLLSAASLQENYSCNRAVANDLIRARLILHETARRG